MSDIYFEAYEFEIQFVFYGPVLKILIHFHAGIHIGTFTATNAQIC